VTSAGKGHRHYRLVIIGAGIGGLTAGITLRRAGVDDFVIFEQSDGIGGTWWDNQYPGAEVDTHSHSYSWHFRKFDWSRSHARQPELQKYIQTVVDEQGIRSKICLKTAVVSVAWDVPRQQQAVTLSTGEIVFADLVVSAIGQLNHPRYPSWPGLDDFAGPKFHTARWDHGCDLTGKRVAVVGTGSTASQVVPAIAPIVDRLFLFQREPGWVLPKGDVDFDEKQRAAYLSAGRVAHQWNRWQRFIEIQRGMIRGKAFRPETKLFRAMNKMCLDYIESVFAERPELRDAVTPRYPFSGKRLILNGDFYPALLRDNVELVPHAVTRVTRTGVVDSSGHETPVDVLVMATGFQPANFLSTMSVTGKTGETLQERWRGEATAFLGMSVPGFPNFLMMYGPNTNGGDLFLNHRTAAEFIVRVERRMRRSGATEVEVSQQAYVRFNRWLEKQIARTTWVSSNNYYRAETGRVVTQWPVDAMTYRYMVKTLAGFAHRVRRAPGRGHDLVSADDGARAV
jgi:cation diffusion facilitator CzcD-associated flavoprotein CzcO